MKLFGERTKIFEGVLLNRIEATLQIVSKLVISTKPNAAADL